MVNLLGENKKAYLKLTYLSLKLWINFDIISYLGSRLSQVFSDLYVKNIKKIVCKKKLTVMEEKKLNIIIIH